jgi:hypothetical protein
MIVCLLTDYGHDDAFVGVCHGVIRTIAPEATTACCRWRGRPPAASSWRST